MGADVQASTPARAEQFPEAVPAMVAKWEDQGIGGMPTHSQRQWVAAIGSDPTSANSAAVRAWWNAQMEREKPSRSFAKALAEDVGGGTFPEGGETLTPRRARVNGKVLTPRGQTTRKTVEV